MLPLRLLWPTEWRGDADGDTPGDLDVVCCLLAWISLINVGGRIALPALAAVLPRDFGIFGLLRSSDGERSWWCGSWGEDDEELEGICDQSTSSCIPVTFTPGPTLLERGLAVLCTEASFAENSDTCCLKMTDSSTVSKRLGPMPSIWSVGLQQHVCLHTFRPVCPCFAYKSDSDIFDPAWLG